MRKQIMLSVPHTGTHFIWEMFNRLQGRHGREHTKKSCDFAGKRKGLGEPEDYTKCDEDMLWSHVRAKMDFSTDRKMIVPMRDPLLCMLSHKHRHSHRDVTEISDWFKYLFAAAAPHDPLYIPVDRGMQFPEIRVNLLERVGEHFEVEDKKTKAILLDYATKLWLKNSGHLYPLKLAYYREDWDYLREHAGKEVDVLRENAGWLYDGVVGNLGYVWPELL